MLIELLIAASCASGRYTEACQKAIEASAKQTGVYQNVEKVEDYTKSQANKEIVSTVGAGPAAVVGVAVKTAHDKALVYSIKPTNVLSIDSITTKVGTGTGSVNFQWRF